MVIPNPSATKGNKQTNSVKGNKYEVIKMKRSYFEMICLI